MPLWSLRLDAPLDHLDQIVQKLEDHALSVSFFGTSIEAIFDQKPDQDFWHDQLKLPLEITSVPDLNWLEESYRSFPPLEIADFYIYGSHIDTAVPSGKYGLHINAATAFGTGEHPTTKGCLLALHDLHTQGLLPHSALDMGCGSGILALAMARLWPQIPTIMAIDNDPDATVMTEQNAFQNGLSDQIQTKCQDTPPAQKFDLIVANILAGPLIDLAPALKASLNPNGYIILSGLLQTQAPDVITAYGLPVVRTYPIDEWVSLVLRHV